MFTGIIEETGKIRATTPQVTGIRLQVKANSILEGTKIGDSISVNGCCLTVVRLDDDSLWFDVVEETVRKTNLADLKVGASVNLERALTMRDRLGGHLVQGHVDGIGRLASNNPRPDGSCLITIEAPEALLRYMIQKGSVTVEGVSLTIAELTDDSFSFAMIPHTSTLTTLGTKNLNDPMNIEVDMMAKYAERFLAPFTQSLVINKGK
jgi:riboflavin synthase